MIINKEESSYNVPKDSNPYSMIEVHKMLKQRQTNNSPANTQDLIYEINNLKKEIHYLKNESKNLENRISILEKGKLPIDNQNLIRQSEETEFLQTLQIIRSQKWFVKVKLLIDNNFTKQFIVLIDSGADLNCIKEGLIPIKYFQKTTHSLSVTNHCIG